MPPVLGPGQPGQFHDRLGLLAADAVQLEQALGVAGQDPDLVALDPVHLGDRPAHLLGDLLAGQPGCSRNLLSSMTSRRLPTVRMCAPIVLPPAPENVIVRLRYCIVASADAYSP